MEKNKKKANEKIIFKVSVVFEGNLNTLHTSNILQQKSKQKYRKIEKLYNAENEEFTKS